MDTSRTVTYPFSKISSARSSSVHVCPRCAGPTGKVTAIDGHSTIVELRTIFRYTTPLSLRRHHTPLPTAVNFCGEEWGRNMLSPESLNHTTIFAGTIFPMSLQLHAFPCLTECLLHHLLHGTSAKCSACYRMAKWLTQNVTVWIIRTFEHAAYNPVLRQCVQN